MTYDHFDQEGLLARYERSGGLADKLKQPLKGTPIDSFYIARKQRDRVRRLGEIGIAERRLAPIDHHTAHAAAAYYGSGWSGKILVLTCDGSGDRLSATVSIGESGRLKRIAAIEDNDSIGRLYAMVTYYMGMTPLEHEYKVMGLAPYVGDAAKAKEHAQLFANLFEFDAANPLIWRRRPGVPPMYSAYGFLSDLLYRQRFDLVAAGLQQFTEDLLLTWVANCARATGLGRVACSGGVFMNVKANGKILALPEVDELFIFPSCGDETNSVGAAYEAHAQECLRENRPVDIEPLQSIYSGDDIEDAETEAALKELKDGHARSSFACRYVDDIESLTAETMARARWWREPRGGWNSGARALGNRSILAGADNMQVVRVINDMIKNRDFWMPFAPAVLAERANDYYVKPKPMPAPYMIIAFDTRPEARQKCPAGQHPYDHSVRPQEVTAEANPDYYRLIKRYEEITGEGIILNTSFNLHGYPIVNRPAEALDVFDRSGLHYLALGNWWVWKE